MVFNACDARPSDFFSPVVGNLPSRESFSLSGKCCALSDERARVSALRQ